MPLLYSDLVDRREHYDEVRMIRQVNWDAQHEAVEIERRIVSRNKQCYANKQYKRYKRERVRMVSI